MEKQDATSESFGFLLLQYSPFYNNNNSNNNNTINYLVLLQFLF